MKQPVLLALAALTRAVLSATDISELQDQLPDCSIECIAEGAAKFDCAITDISCQCSKMEEITQEVSPCLVNKGGCSFEEVTDTASAVSQICEENSKTKSGGNLTDASSDQPSHTSSTAGESQPTETPDAAVRLQCAGVVGAVVMAAGASLL